MSNGDAFISVCFFATCGAGLSIFLLTFNIKYRSLRFIKMTSPNINAIILAASFGLYGCCVLLIMEPNASYSAASATALCQVRLWLLSTSVVTYLAAMFAKGWRVSRLFHYSSVRRIVIKDATLLGLVATFSAGDGALLLLWYLVDPLECLDVGAAAGAAWPAAAATPNGTWPPWPAMRVVYASVSCQSRYFHAWSCGLFLYAIGVVLACVVVGWKIRHIRSPSLDDSRCILFTVHSSLVTLAVATWVGGSLDAVKSAGPFVNSCALWVATTLSLCFNFIPKVHAVLKNAGKEPDQLGSSAKYISSDLVADRILTQMTAEVSTMLSGKRRDSLCAEAEESSEPRQRSEASSLRGSSESGHEPAAAAAGERGRSMHADRPSSEEQSEDGGQGRCARFSCNALPRKSRLPDVVSLRCLWPLSEQRKMAAGSSTPTPPPRPSAPEGADAAGRRGEARNDGSGGGGGFGALPAARYPTADRMRNDDLILSIAGTYNLPDDVDTYSYISSWIPATTYCAFCPRYAVQPGGGGGSQLATIGSDQLYPSPSTAARGGRFDRGFQAGRRRRSERWQPPSPPPPGGSGDGGSRGSAQPQGADLDSVVV